MKDIANIIGARIAGRPTYTPAHTLAGVAKPRTAKIEFNVFKNRDDKKVVYKITAWGKMADAIARGGAVGKEISFYAEIIPFEGRVWMPLPNGSHQFITKPDGTPLMQWKTGYTIMDMKWGDDSAKTIANEIAQGLRPAGWNTPGSPDKQIWLQTCMNKNATQYQNGAATFEYADVELKNLPQGAVIIQTNVANNATPVQQPIMQPVTQPIQQQPQNVVVNGQNMGYAMPTQQPVQPVQQPAVQYAANPNAVGATMAPQPTQAAVMPGGYSPITM